MPTASAVVGDIIALVRNLKLGFVASSPNGSAGERKPVVEREDDAYKYYFRLTAADQPGVFAQVAHLFGEYRASMETVLQKRVEGGRAEIVIVTHEISSRLAREISLHLTRSPQLAVEAVMPVEPVAE
ncbi:hypothetical protein GCM10025858_09440 [Alicyclobacillus sacchari]|nr:ACT domain-containing protein [Alicyclobacillus sacchari]GMA56441.1 hypothetical protein GCM10025858_09440 [Alicyclobacillus sacchari]